MSNKEDKWALFDGKPKGDDLAHSELQRRRRIQKHSYLLQRQQLPQQSREDRKEQQGLQPFRHDTVSPRTEGIKRTAATIQSQAIHNEAGKPLIHPKEVRKDPYAGPKGNKRPCKTRKPSLGFFEKSVSLPSQKRHKSDSPKDPAMDLLLVRREKVIGLNDPNIAAKKYVVRSCQLLQFFNKRLQTPTAVDNASHRLLCLSAVLANKDRSYLDAATWQLEEDIKKLDLADVPVKCEFTVTPTWCEGTLNTPTLEQTHEAMTLMLECCLVNGLCEDLQRKANALGASPCKNSRLEELAVSELVAIERTASAVVLQTPMAVQLNDALHLMVDDGYSLSGLSVLSLGELVPGDNDVKLANSRFKVPGLVASCFFRQRNEKQYQEQLQKLKLHDKISRLLFATTDLKCHLELKLVPDVDD